MRWPSGRRRPRWRCCNSGRRSGCGRCWSTRRTHGVRSFLIHRLEPLTTDVRSCCCGGWRRSARCRGGGRWCSAWASYPVEPLAAEAAGRSGCRGCGSGIARSRTPGYTGRSSGCCSALGRRRRGRPGGEGVGRCRSPGATAVAGQRPGADVGGGPGRAPFWMGSPGDEAGRTAANESLHRVRIPRSFAIAAKEVTVEQFLRFQPKHRYIVKYSPRPGRADHRRDVVSGGGVLQLAEPGGGHPEGGVVLPAEPGGAVRPTGCGWRRVT